jgi:hypothetical protein
MFRNARSTNDGNHRDCTFGTVYDVCVCFRANQTLEPTRHQDRFWTPSGPPVGLPSLSSAMCLLHLYVFKLNNARHSTRPYNEGRRLQCHLLTVNARIEDAIGPGESLI